MTTCSHLASIDLEINPRAEGCEDCLRTGDAWVHLRVCRSAGTSAAVTHRPIATPPRTIGTPTTRSSAPSSRVRSGSGATGTRWGSSWRTRRQHRRTPDQVIL